MAERYAAQRSNKETRRRSLPRLSDSATAVHEREFPADEADLAAPTAVIESVHERAHPPVHRAQRPSMPRGMAQPRAGSAPTVTHVDYSYVKRDLRRIAVIGISMLVLLIVLNVILQAVIIH